MLFSVTDEVHFHLNCFVNEQNFRYWRVENARTIINEEESRLQCVTMWCAIICDRIIGAYFFENAKGLTETVNGEIYRHMLNTFVSPVVIYLRNHHELWFQQDGVTCRTAN